MAFLIIESGPETGKKVLLNGVLVIGRQAGTGLTIQDAKASREHTRLEPAAGGYAVIDLESRNGTLLNGRKVTREFLNPGDRITVGATVFRFELADATPSATTRPMPPEPPKAAARVPGGGGAAPMQVSIHSESIRAVETPRPVPPPAAAAAPATPRPHKEPKLRYQDKGGGVGIVGIIVCVIILAGLVVAGKFIGQKAIKKIMDEKKATTTP